ncbi:MAG: hypothetical protein CBE24_03010 [bacterium TMED264]|nr:MAG: hypothetical protein CBE24_03010 [bacterium TMED264]
MYNKLKKIFFFLIPILVISQSKEGSISGTIFGNQEPLIGANVILDKTLIGSTTDSEGNYSITNIPLGKYLIRVEYLGFETQTKEVYISEEDENPSNSNLSSSFSDKIGLEKDEVKNLLKANHIKELNFYLTEKALDLNEIVVSASKVQQKITDAPSVVSVVNQKNIRRRVGITDYNRLAAVAKGVDVTYFGSSGAQINARGFDGAYNSRFRQFSDGLYIGESVTGQVYSLLSGPPKEAISRIEILFGPQSALYGPDASQGLLNIITKHPMQESTNEINFSMSSLNDPRLGVRYAKNYKNISFDISGETKFHNEIPYGNDDDDLYWVVDEDTLYLTEDLFEPMELDKNQVLANMYYRPNENNELSFFYNFIHGNGYAMGSLGPIYFHNLKNHKYGFRLNNDNHFFRVTSNRQRGKALNRITLGLFQIQNSSNGLSMPWRDALSAIESSDSYWWLVYNSDDIMADYQYNNSITDRLKLVTGFDYEFKDPNTERQTLNDFGYSRFKGTLGGRDIKEYRYGVYGQIDFLINNDLSINSSLRYDDHEFYGETISPRASLVRKNFLNGTLKLIAGTGFKAPTLMERNIYTGTANIGSGLEGSQDLLFSDFIYPEDWKADAIAMGSSDGFTVTEFIDMNDNGTFESSDSLLQRDFFEPLKLEENQSLELAYTGVINSKNFIEVNLYRGKYKNFKGPLTAFAFTGPHWNYFGQILDPLDEGALRQVHYGDNPVSDDPIPQFTYCLTYSNLPLDVTFYGFESGWKHLHKNLELSINFSYFHDKELVDRRKKGKDYLNAAEENRNPNHIGFVNYANVYSNTPNFKGAFSITNQNGLIEKLTSTINLKWTSAYDFSSGNFRATEEGKGEIPPANSGVSWFRDNGRIGGTVYADIDLLYEASEQIICGFSIKNIFETSGPTMPLTPKIPRSFSFEVGYRFN